MLTILGRLILAGLVAGIASAIGAYVYFMATNCWFVRLADMPAWCLWL